MLLPVFVSGAFQFLVIDIYVTGIISNGPCTCAVFFILGYIALLYPAYLGLGSVGYQFAILRNIQPARIAVILFAGHHKKTGQQ